MKNYKDYRYFENRPDVVKVWEDLEAYHDWCRLELCDFNPADLYRKDSVNYGAFLARSVLENHIKAISLDGTTTRVSGRLMCPVSYERQDTMFKLSPAPRIFLQPLLLVLFLILVAPTYTKPVK